MNKRSFSAFTEVFVATALIGFGLVHANAQTTTKATTPNAPAYVIGTPPPGCVLGQMRCITQQMRVDAARRAKAAGKKRIKMGLAPLGFPDYFNVANWALSPLPETTIDPTTGLATAVTNKGIRKFVDSLPGIGAANHNTLGTYIPLAVPITTGRPGVPADGDYYEIGLKDSTHQFHSDLPATTQVRTYRDMNPAAADTNPHYLGPIIIARKDRPVRVKFTNELAISSVLFLPIDTTLMGAGAGVEGLYSENRATLHLHGGTNPWISDGIPHQWITPAADPATLHRGVSTRDVPDMWWDAVSHLSVAPGTAGATTNPGDGSNTFYWANQQGSRLQFYHDHAFGLTRLNVYAGEAAGYLITDPAEDGMIASGAIPGKNMPAVYKYGIPLILQDKSFVPSSTPNTNFPGDLNGGQLGAQDPTWDTAHWGPAGNLWFPHVYMPNQNPADDSGAGAFGRWDYGPWFWPPQDPSTYVPTGQPVVGTGLNGCALGVVCPGTPNPSVVPEGFMDTMLVNGTAYPYLPVAAQAYRFRILNASNDRALNLSLFKADMTVTGLSAPSAAVATGTEVKMVGAVPPVFVSKTACIETATSTVDPVTQLPNNPVGCWPSAYPTDGRVGGVPDPLTAGPAFIQIGSEGGLLPAPAIIPAGPVNYNYNRKDIVVLNIAQHGLFLMPAQRADVIVDFSSYASGTKIILYNDSPAPVPAFDPRVDYYTGAPDQTTTGGAPTTLAGWGPNTRTVMQFIVGAAPGTADVLNLAVLNAALPVAYAATQPPPIVPEKAYDAAFGTITALNTYARIQNSSLTFLPSGSVTPVTMPMAPKAIQELFTLDYGRMNATLGVEIPNSNFTVQTTIPYGYIDPITETIVDGQPTLWRITHNGVDTHPVHFHLFNVQIINRVGWDGAIRPPEPNELGWKETVTMNPLEDVVVAFLPQSMKNLPFAVPDSIRLLDVTAPEHSTGQFYGVDQFNNPVTVTNEYTNFGWEYVWHCHILGHEENDFMRPVRFVGKATMVSPIIGSTLKGSTVTFLWAKGAGVNSTYIDVGTTGVGSTNLTGVSSPGALLTKTLTNVPLVTGTAYVRLWSVINGTAMYNDYTYTTTGPIPAAMISPATGTTLTSTTVTFTWTAGTNVASYWLYVGTTLGANNLASYANATATSYTTNTLPSNGSTVYVRLRSMIGGVWYFNDYTYTAVTAAPSVMISPVPSTTLTSASVTFRWTPGTAVTNHWLQVGTTLGASNLASYANLTATSYTVNNLPTNGSTVYVRLRSLIGGTWQNIDYTYTVVATGLSVMISPVPSSTLTSATVTFTWTPGTNVTSHWIYVGTTLGANNLASYANATATSYTTNTLPSDGSTVYVRLRSLIGGVWSFNDYTYTAVTAVPSVMISPVPSSRFTSTSVTFTWTPGTAVTNHWLYVGTTLGANNLASYANLTATSYTVNNLPTNGSTVYVRLRSLIGGTWQNTDYTYTSQ